MFEGHVFETTELGHVVEVELSLPDINSISQFCSQCFYNFIGPSQEEVNKGV